MPNQRIPEVQMTPNEGNISSPSSSKTVSVPGLPTVSGATAGTRAATSTGITMRKRKRTSIVWKEFIQIPKEKNPDGRQRAKCKACGNIYLADSDINGTGSLRRHLKNCTKRKNKDVAQMILSGGDGNLTCKSKKIDAEMVRDMITMLIVRRELPLVFVEYQEFRDLITYLYPQFSPISRNTQLADILRWHNRESKRIKEFLNSFNGRMSLTTDLWSSITTDSYISLTCHYIDIEWILHKKLLKFCIMPPPHIGVNISQIASEMLLYWGIEKKLFSITLDNASANLSLIDHLKRNLVLKKALMCDGDFFHNRCCAHILNLIVQDGLKVIDNCVQLVRSSVAYVKASQARKVKFLECCKQVGLPNKKGLHGDVTMRWNSTYHMLDSAIFYKSAFHELQLVDKNYRECPSNEEWSKVEQLMHFLKPFNDITEVLSGSKYPTANLYFHNVWNIHKSLLEVIVHGDDHMKKMAQEMKKKFDKYWDSDSIILAIAVVFDPLYKLSFVSWAFDKIYNLDSRLREKFRLVKTSLERLFEEHRSMDVIMEEGALHSDDIETDMVGNASDWQELNAYESSNNTTRSDKSELYLYLEEPRIKDTTKQYDVLAYWKSAGGRVIDKYRSKLLPTNAEALICLRDWMFGVDFRAELGDDANDLADALKDVLSVNESGVTNEAPGPQVLSFDLQMSFNLLVLLAQSSGLF
ncbi:zinc finger BED domain-containing protein RICESLEEPER 2-like [Telopea speciosissima]|uniref:zinc finger BED domain-containing protein RICESLEEPER 2-like n=1 Tax=Telopea speciosissima TaxID=54955 RepID=UPI001CC70ADB|nr:zinc finger BED domain-containing protein RICESLEEPER 2-like [Telopea speciosissima]